jgi:hypothetical protein
VHVGPLRSETATAESALLLRWADQHLADRQATADIADPVQAVQDALWQACYPTLELR